MMTSMLRPQQKAAVVVRLLLEEGGDMSLDSLPPELQGNLADEMAKMGMIDRATRDGVIEEFCEMLENVGLAFPGDMDGTLDILGDLLSPDTADRLRRIAASSGKGDPWTRITAFSTGTIVDLASTEAVEVAAVMFSQLPVPKAAEAMARLPQERVRAISYAMSMVNNIRAPSLLRIGQALVLAAEAIPRAAIDGAPVEKVGAILNFSPADMRDSVLTGLDEDDPDFARDVRKAIFTWINIPQRIDARDIPRVIRQANQNDLIRAMAGAKGHEEATVEYILNNLGTRVADGLRDSIEQLDKPKRKDTDDAMASVISSIRSMEEAGELFLIAGESDGTEEPGDMQTAME